MKYKNLNAELARNGISVEQLAKKVGINKATMLSKLNGKRPFKFVEVKSICSVFEFKFPVEFLFEELFQR